MHMVPEDFDKSHVFKIVGESEKTELRQRCLDVDSFCIKSGVMLIICSCWRFLTETLFTLPDVLCSRQ